MRRGAKNKESLDKPTPVQQGAPNTASVTDAQTKYRNAQKRAGDAAVKAQPNPRLEEIADPMERRIEYLRAKSDRTLEEGLELQELELGVERSREINSGWTASQVHAEQTRLRENEKAVEAEEGYKHGPSSYASSVSRFDNQR